MKQVKWGIIGLGNIALKFAEGFQYTKNAKLFAISSRNKNKLLTFKNKFQIDDNYCFTNYDSLLECKDLNIVYIALPNSFHHEWVIKSIEKGKNILVEKPATVNFSQMENIKNNLKEAQASKLQLEFLYHFHKLFNQLQTLNHTYPHISSLTALRNFYNEIMSTQSLDFQGRPFKGLQLMGMLESRALDFEKSL